VAGPTSGDPPVSSTNGGVAGQQESMAAIADTLEGARALADRRQTLADSDHTRSDSDQTSCDDDQAAADGDQAASDRALEEGGDAELHRLTRVFRDSSSQQREQAAERRLEAAAARDAAAHARDLVALARDQAAAMRDWQLATRDVDDARAVTHAEIGLRAAENRERAADDREAAAKARGRAAADRAKAARDRAQAAYERLQAQSERADLLHQLEIAETDALTGTRTRAAGLAELGREIDRAHSTKGTLVAAYIDIVGLKAANEAEGRAAGDALLRRTARAIRARLRSSDLVLRLGDDEFLCAMPGDSIENARLRFRAVQATLAEDDHPCEINVGFAALTPADSADELIKRAGAELPGSSRS
jgi:diguanylate cyclase (GGDEF)-like protein